MHVRSIRSTLVVFVMVTAGCTLGKDTGDVSLLDDDDETGYSVEDATIEITSPVGSVYATDSIDIVVSTTAEPERIELKRDGEAFAVFPNGSTRYTWHVSSELEKTYELTAVAKAPDGEIESAPVQVIVDHTPPLIVTRSPEPDAADFDLREPIWIEFDQPLNPETVGTDTVTFAKKGINLILIQIPDREISVDLTLSEDRKRIDLHPTEEIVGPAPLKITLSGVEDDAGNKISEKSWDWHAAGWADATAPIAGLVKPALELDGSTMWVQGQRASGRFVVLRRDETEWTEVVEYDPNAPAPVTPFDFVLADDASEAWSLFRTPNAYQIVRYDLSSASAEMISERPLETRPALAIDETGEVFLAHDDGVGALSLNRWTADTGWEEVASVPGTGEPTDCQLSAADRLVLVATDQTTGEATFWEFDKTDWSVMDLPINPSDSPSLRAVGEPTGTHAVSVEEVETGTYMQVRRYNESGVWPALLDDNPDIMQDRVNNEPEWEVRRPTLRVQGNGEVWLAWEEFESTRPVPVSRVHVRRWDSDRWYAHTSSMGMSPDDPTWTTHPNIELRAPGDPVVVYQVEQTTRAVQLNKYEP